MTDKKLTVKEAKKFNELKTLLESAEFALRKAEGIALKQTYTVKFYGKVMNAAYKARSALMDIQFVNTGEVFTGGKRA